MIYRINVKQGLLKEVAKQIYVSWSAEYVTRNISPAPSQWQLLTDPSTNDRHTNKWSLCQHAYADDTKPAFPYRKVIYHYLLKNINENKDTTVTWGKQCLPSYLKKVSLYKKMHNTCNLKFHTANRKKKQSSIFPFLANTDTQY